MKLQEKIALGLGKAWIHSVAAAEQLIHGASIDLLSVDLAHDPYPTLNRLRESHPFFYTRTTRSTWVTRFDHVQEILRDKRFGADVRKYPDRVKRITRHFNEEERAVFDNPSMLDLDPPDHSRIRRLAQQGFVQKFIASLEPDIRQIVEDCFASVSNQPTIDIVETLAKPLPAIVIARMMGLPETDLEQFQRWSEDLIDGSSTNDVEKVQRSNRASRKLRQYFADLVRSRRGQPGDDLVGRLIAAEEEGDKLTEIELYNTCFLLLVAGHETTTRLIGNGLWLLLSHPEQFEWLKANPERVPLAVEEMLRFEPPVQATRRFATEDIEFHGHSFKRGDFIFVSLAGANRDPRANPDPESFDVRRETVNQIGFGYGIHLCLGITLARLEAKVAFEELLTRFPNMTLTSDTPTWGDTLIFRGLRKLEIDPG